MSAHDIIAWLNAQVPDTAHLCMDSRQIQAGDVFMACPGRSGDGRDYIVQAVQRGAAAVVMQSHPDGAPGVSVPVLQYDGLSSRLGEVAHEWYGRPSEAVSVIAVTGTNGKTSCVNWIAAALNAESIACGAIGTLGVRLPNGRNLGGALTTPDVLTLHRSVAAMRDAGAQVVAMEASSIGIEQGRMAGIHVAVAGFTNLTHDHLDYHQTFDNYKQAKFALFAWPGLQAAIVNIDDAAGRELLARCADCLRVTYSIQSEPGATLRADDIHAGSDGLIFNLVTPDGTAQLLTRLVGEHNISNVLLVAGILRWLGWDLSRIARVLASLRPVEGRLQAVEPAVPSPRPSASPLVVVDYAHTPDALERALMALRDVASARSGRLICVFGCGGERDTLKRPVMGRLAARLADAVILTSDNPRREDPRVILEQIVAGMPSRPVVEPDRAHAILQVLWRANSADVVLLAGKGHETYQEFDGYRVPFDDREWARFALSWRNGLDISTDTRTLHPGALFVALKGETFDGHAFLHTARERGACAALVETADPDVDLPQFALGDTSQALIRIATAWRETFHGPVIAVTGSNGKTTTKEMIAAILRRAYGEEGALATRGNLNNAIGVPLTILRLRARHRAAVVELGMNHPGEIQVLADIARPTVALVNNAQREHQEFMHTVEAVARENGAVLAALPQDGVAVFPGDDVFTPLWQLLAGSRPMMRFGFEPHFDIHADMIHAAKGGTACQLHTPDGSAPMRINAPGVHNLRNAMAAAACALSAGVSLADVVRGLEQFSPVSGRMQPYLLSQGFQLIDDSYNANPDSVRAAIDVLAQLSGMRILVLGDMAEVGDNSRALHAEVGAYAREQGVDRLLAVGSASTNAVQAFGPGGKSYAGISELVAELEPLLPANVLVKGSRSARMERVVQALTHHLPAQEGGHHAA